MKTKKLTLLFSLMMLVAFILSACNPAATETPAAPPTEAQAETPAAETVPTEAPQTEPTEAPTVAPAPEAEVTLTVWVDEKQYPVIDEMKDKLLTEYGVNLVVQQLGFGDLQQQFLIAAPAGEGPDVLATAHNTLGEIVNNGLVIPLDLGDDVANYTPASIQAWTYNGELYGLPYATENVAFFIRTDIVPECPATWTDVLAISRELSAGNGEDIAANKYGFVRMDGDPYHFFPIQTAFGGYVFGYTDQGYNPNDVGLDSPGSLAAATWWDAYMKEKLQPEGVDGLVMMDMFESGQSAMTITGPWNTQRVIDSGVPFAICPIPGETVEFGQPFMGSFGFVISAFSENPLVAEIFVKEFLNTQETMQALYDVTPQVPAHLGVLAGLDDPYLAAYGQAGLNAQAMPAIPEMGSVWSAWGNAVTLISQQADDPVDAFTNAAEQIRTAISGGTKVDIEMVNIPGTAQTAMGCSGNWDPACEGTALTAVPNGKWMGVFPVPAGDYEVKAAINGGWDINYGKDGKANGDNIPFSVAADGYVAFIFDSALTTLTIAPVEMVNIPGTLQSALGCAGDWDPTCAATALTPGDGGTWTGTFNVPAGEYEFKIALNGGWDLNYGVDGVPFGDNIPLSLAADSTVTITFDLATGTLEVTTE
ncbi:MAG: extracellular solute-binding protein [Anaerolineales bacterium]|nr:extracellular solute-binding protein [Anaerolineales bacterium]